MSLKECSLCGENIENGKCKQCGMDFNRQKPQFRLNENCESYDSMARQQKDQHMKGFQNKEEASNKKIYKQPKPVTWHNRTRLVFGIIASVVTIAGAVLSMKNENDIGNYTQVGEFVSSWGSEAQEIQEANSMAEMTAVEEVLEMVDLEDGMCAGRDFMPGTYDIWVAEGSGLVKVYGTDEKGQDTIVSYSLWEEGVASYLDVLVEEGQTFEVESDSEKGLTVVLVPSGGEYYLGE